MSPDLFNLLKASTEGLYGVIPIVVLVSLALVFLDVPCVIRLLRHRLLSTDFLDSSRFVFYVVPDEDRIESIVASGLPVGTEVIVNPSCKAMFKPGACVLVFDKHVSWLLAGRTSDYASLKLAAHPVVAILKDAVSLAHRQCANEAVSAQYQDVRSRWEAIAKKLGATPHELRVQVELITSGHPEKSYLPCGIALELQELAKLEDKLFDKMTSINPNVKCSKTSVLMVLRRYCKYKVPVRNLVTLLREMKT